MKYFQQYFKPCCEKADKTARETFGKNGIWHCLKCAREIHPEFNPLTEQRR